MISNAMVNINVSYGPMYLFSSIFDISDRSLVMFQTWSLISRHLSPNTWTLKFKTVFMFSSREHEIYSGHKF